MTDRSVLARRDCECHAARGLVKFCALHQAAGEMLTALEGLLALDAVHYLIADEVSVALAAVKAAKGGGS